MAHGTGAGNPPADLLFTIAFSRLVVRLRARFLEAGLTARCRTSGAADFCGFVNERADGVDVVPLADTSYADDLAVIVEGPADGFIEGLRVAAQVLWEVYETAGVRVNFGPAKTAALVKWSGNGRWHAQITA